jgi:hypothetical protein
MMILKGPFMMTACVTTLPPRGPNTRAVTT